MYVLILLLFQDHYGLKHLKLTVVVFPVISCLDLLDFAWLLNTCPYSGYDAGFDCSMSSREIIDVF